ncbi:MAG: transposase [Nitrospira sp.]|nr:transposase [Nitrospira sp.]
MAHARPRFGYQRIWVLLRREGWLVNRKRVRRLYRLEGVQLRMRVRRRKHIAAQGMLMDYNYHRPHSSLGHLTPSKFINQRQTKQTVEEIIYSGSELSQNGTNVSGIRKIRAPSS